MDQLPPPDSIAFGLLVVGVLFALRFALALRRLTRDGRPGAPVSYLRPPRQGAFGDDMEPNRRYAARQYYQAALFLGAGLVLFAYVLAMGLPVTLGRTA